MEAGLTGLDIPAFGDPTDFMAGFGIGDLTESERTRRRLHSLCLALVMVVETKYRGTERELYAFGRQQLDALMTALGSSPAPE